MNNNSLEVCLNLWFVVDKDANLIYRALARVYALAGADEEKAKILESLSGSDFHIAKPFSLSKYKTTIVDKEGKQRELSGFFSQNVDMFLPDIFETVCSDIEKELPAQPFVTLEENRTYKMEIPKVPYYVLTFLIDDDTGILKPN